MGERDRWSGLGKYVLVWMIAYIAQARDPGTGEILSVPCYSGTLWEALLTIGDLAPISIHENDKENEASIWTKSLEYTGLSILLNKPTPGAALVVPIDSGLVPCSFDLDPECLLAERWWYWNLTNPIGVGQLMFHWIPDAGLLSEGLDDLAVGEEIVVSTLLNNATNGSWPLIFSRSSGNSSSGLATVSLPPDMMSDTLAAGDGGTSHIVDVINTCENGAIYVVDHPLLPASLPQADVNSLRGLETFCWHSIAQLIIENAPDFYTEREKAQALLLYHPVFFHLVIDPRANITLLVQGKELMEFYKDYISFLIENPVSTWYYVSAPALLNSIPGGWSEKDLSSKPWQTVLGFFDEASRLSRYNFSTTCPETFCATIWSLDDPRNIIFSYKGLKPLGNACYSRVYAYNNGLESSLQRALNSAMPNAKKLYEFTKIDSKKLFREDFISCDLEDSSPVTNSSKSALNGKMCNVQKNGDLLFPPSENFQEGDSTSEQDITIKGGIIAGIVIGSLVGLFALSLSIIYLLKYGCGRQLLLKTESKSRSQERHYNFIAKLFHKCDHSKSKRIFHGSIQEKPNYDVESLDGKEGNNFIPSVPWDDILLHREDITWDVDPVSGERIVLGSGRFGRVYKGTLCAAETVAIKCIRIADGISSDINVYEESGTESRTIKLASNTTIPEIDGIDSSEYMDSQMLSSESLGRIHGVKMELSGGISSVQDLKMTPLGHIMREIALLKGFRSQHIVGFLGACILEKEVLLLTEFMPGGDLWSALRQDHINWWNRGHEIALDVSIALVYLHCRRVVHLDVKSSNILLKYPISYQDHGGSSDKTSARCSMSSGLGDFDDALDQMMDGHVASNDEITMVKVFHDHPPGLAKLSDVGIAKILPVSQEYLVSSDACGGTWPWAAPECILGQKCGPAADIYSLGVVLWEIVTGEVPVRGMMRDIKVEDECPAEVVKLISSCWEVNPADRPTALDIVSELKRVREKSVLHIQSRN